MGSLVLKLELELTSPPPPDSLLVPLLVFTAALLLPEALEVTRTLSFFGLGLGLAVTMVLFRGALFGVEDDGLVV